MDFELTMRLLFGDKAYHIAGSEGNLTNRRKWLQKAVRQLLCHVDDLDTNTRHKRMLMAELDGLQESLKGIKEPSWSIVYCLLRLCIRLFGYDFGNAPGGARCHTPIFCQTESQYYTSHILEGGDVMQDYYDNKDAVSIRSSVAKQLHDQGLNDFKISLVLNTSENAIKQLRKLSD